MNKKKIGIVTCIALLVAFGVTMFAVGGAQEEDASADVATVTKDGKEITVDKEGNEVKVTKDGEVEIVKEDVVSKSEATKAIDNKSSSVTKKNNTPAKSNATKPSSSSTPATTSKPAPSKPSTPTKPAEPTKPAHTHSWTPVYATKQVQVGTERKPVSSYYVCKRCGTINPDGLHLVECNSSEYKDYVYENVPIYETQKYVSYYKCSCGATK